MAYISHNHSSVAGPPTLRVYVLGPAWVEWQGEPLVAPCSTAWQQSNTRSRARSCVSASGLISRRARATANSATC